MFPSNIIYGGLSDFAYLVKSGHTPRNKSRIFFSWLKINLKFLFSSGNKSERIFGYKIDAFDYGTIRALFEEVFYRNEYLFNSKNKKPVIFDCGANIGFTTIFLKWLYPESEIYAFEPDKRTFRMLEKNVLQNRLKNVHLFNAAISGKNGKINFFFDSKNPGSLVMSTKRERMPKDRVVVDCISLSSLIKNEKIHKIDLIKMDIEGSEKEAIEDLYKNNQLAKAEKLIVEYHHKIGSQKSCLGEFLQMFEKSGFEYQIDAKCMPVNSEDKFQDVLLYIYKR